MKIKKKLLDGVLILQQLSENPNDSSVFSYDITQLRTLGITEKFVQENHSLSFKNVLRGLHFQENDPQGKLIRILSGTIFDVFVDLRRGSPSFGQYASYVLSSTNRELVWVPPGYAHGFLALEESEVVYNVTKYRNVGSEKTLLWNDKFINIAWPLINTDPIISEKDRNGALWQELNYFD